MDFFKKLLEKLTWSLSVSGAFSSKGSGAYPEGGPSRLILNILEILFF